MIIIIIYIMVIMAYIAFTALNILIIAIIVTILIFVIICYLTGWLDSDSIGSRIVYELNHRKPVIYVIPIQISWEN